jgi:hypothetical protein
LALRTARAVKILFSYSVGICAGCGIKNVLERLIYNVTGYLLDGIKNVFNVDLQRDRLKSFLNGAAAPRRPTRDVHRRSGRVEGGGIFQWIR